MAIDLPGPIAAYFAADSGGDADAVSRCFTDDAVVKDEGKTHVGRDAIKRWKAGASAAYSYTVEPFAITLEGADADAVVTSHLVGSFPGSPIDLRYAFGLKGDAIAALEIMP